MLANIILDLILVTLLVLGAIIGAKRGFIATIAKPVKLAMSIGFSTIFCKWFGTAFVQPIISKPITNKLSELLLEKYSEISAETSGGLPTIIKLAAGLSGIDLGAITSDGDEYIYTLIDKITEPVVRIAATVISFLVLLVVFSIVFAIIIWLLDKLINRGIIGRANQIIGAIFTFCFSFVIAWAIASVTDFVFNLPAFSDLSWVQEFTGGFVYRFFKSISPLELLLSF